MTDTPEHKLTTQQSDWLEKLNACKASGKSMKAFAISKGLDIQDLYSWKKILVKKGVLPRSRTPRFQQVQIMDTTGYEYRILLPNGVTVILPSGAHDINLENILHSAKQLLCCAHQTIFRQYTCAGILLISAKV